jgi:hypothetical protein
MALKLSELIASYGDDKVEFQNLDQCIDTLDWNGKTGVTKIKFGAEQPINSQGTEKLGLVVWFDRDRVNEIIAVSKTGA